MFLAVPLEEISMYNIFEDEDDIFMGSPRSKFHDVIFNASRGVVEGELERLIERQAVLEFILGEEQVEALDKKIVSLKFEHAQELESMVKSLYVESMGNILTQAE